MRWKIKKRNLTPILVAILIIVGGFFAARQVFKADTLPGADISEPPLNIIEGTGGFWGQLVGTDGKPLTSVEITLGPHVMTSNNQGYFSLFSISPGRYPVSFSRGRRSFRIKDDFENMVDILPGSAQASNFTLELGDLAPVTLPNPIAYWPMDETSGTRVADTSGNGNNGIAENATITDGKIGKARDFYFSSSGSSLVSVTRRPQLKTNDVFSVSAWVTVSTVSQVRRTLIANYVGWDETEWNVRTENGNIVFSATGQSGYLQAQKQFTPNLSEWYHVVGVRDKNILKLYINGQLAGSSATSDIGVKSSQGAEIGLSPRDSTWQGKIDEVKIFDKALDAAQVSKLYSN